MAEFHRLSQQCRFDAYLDQALRDRLVWGLQNESTQRGFLSEADLTLAKAMDIAQGREAAERNAKVIQEHGGGRTE